ncbi:MAG: cobalamin B12-binding domain-containing protein [Bacteroidales bacterium]|nr:cobalamin B12-binding domain-containing protein [Bacteroidales bacterium]
MNPYHVQSYVNELLAGNRKTSSVLCHSYYKEQGDILSVYENLMMPSLYQIGTLWETNKISVAAEHLATAITESILNEFYNLIIPQKVYDKKVLAACVDGEYHQVGIKMVADTFEMNGWDSYFLGANVPTKEIIRYAKQIQPHVIALSLSVYFHFPQLLQMIQEIKSEMPKMEILVGGQGLKHVSASVLSEYSKLTYIKHLYQIEDYLKSIKS